MYSAISRAGCGRFSSTSTISVSLSSAGAMKLGERSRRKQDFGTTGFLGALFLQFGTVAGLLVGRLMAVAAVRIDRHAVAIALHWQLSAPVRLDWPASLTGIVLGVGVSLLARG